MLQSGARRFFAVLLALAIGLAAAGHVAQQAQSAQSNAPLQVADPGGGTGGNGG